MSALWSTEARGGRLKKNEKNVKNVKNEKKNLEFLAKQGVMLSFDENVSRTYEMKKRLRSGGLVAITFGNVRSYSCFPYYPINRTLVFEAV